MRMKFKRTIKIIKIVLSFALLDHWDAFIRKAIPQLPFDSAQGDSGHAERSRSIAELKHSKKKPGKSAGR
jgi:hypothetical protein